MFDTQNLPKELESTAIARFQDCDPFSHLNNARYIDYFLNARENQLALSYNFNIFDHGKTLNANWVMTKTRSLTQAGAVYGGNPHPNTPDLLQ